MTVQTEGRLLKAIIFLAIVCIALIAGKFALTDFQKKSVTRASAQTVFKASLESSPEETIITYREFEGMPVQLLINHETAQVCLRLKLDMKHRYGADGTLEFLKSEVERFYGAGKPIELGDTGISFHLTGLPIWGPHGQYLPERGQFQSLYFAQNAKITKHLIEATGVERPNGYWPYQVVWK
jgi:hypothetical protein